MAEIAEVSRPAMRSLIEIFREWNRQWDLYDKDPSRPKPLSADEFALELDGKFKLEPRANNGD